uniref:Uncharacterized protein LOC113788360 n=1 Tax=Dermatophagoides pteronyssinus TaxID=6956 RepID=A0A6P6XP22_DERPT|nr:uncharacterized protein LOC113788360 [Dermatophagoides pteronyssinus]
MSLDAKTDIPRSDEFLNLYSRQIGTFGYTTMLKLTRMRVFILGINGVGIEIAKNITLTGPSSVTIKENKIVEWTDLGVNFYCKKEHVGKVPISNAVLPALQNLCSFVSVKIFTDDLTEANIDNFDVVITCNQLNETNIYLNQLCRKFKKGFISTFSYGLFGSIFVDFGDKHIIYDKLGEKSKSYVIERLIVNESESIICIQANSRLEIEVNNKIKFSSLSGVENSVLHEKLKNGVFRVKDVKKDCVYIDLECESGIYQFSGNIATLPIEDELSFEPFERLAERLYKSGQSYIGSVNMARENSSELLFVFWKALLQLPNIDALDRKKDYTNEIMANIEKVSSQLRNQSDRWKNILDSLKNKKLFEQLARHVNCEFLPVATIIGAIASQEAIKYLGKYIPLNQWFFFDCSEVVPDSKVDTQSISESRYESLFKILGETKLKELQTKSVFLVGTGAIGCELIKLLALLGCSTQGGKIVATDMDSIEISNLNRQFLFHREHIGKSKSQVACSAALEMNPDLNIEALCHKVDESTENIFSNEFWKSNSCILNALDNIKSRNYIDSRCVWNGVPLLDSGTLGLKGSVQAIIPHLTKSYAQSTDPDEESIPLCTIRHFPTQIDHTIEWSRELEDDFVPSNVTIEINQDISKKKKETRIDSVLENEQVAQLYKQFKSLNGADYSRLNAIKPIEFEKDDDSNCHIKFIYAASNLRATAYNIETVSFHEVKFIAGKIVQAVITTTSLVAGFVMIELVKLDTLTQSLAGICGNLAFSPPKTGEEKVRLLLDYLYPCRSLDPRIDGLFGVILEVAAGIKPLPTDISLPPPPSFNELVERGVYPWAVSNDIPLFIRNLFQTNEENAAFIKANLIAKQAMACLTNNTHKGDVNIRLTGMSIEFGQINITNPESIPASRIAICTCRYDYEDEEQIIKNNNRIAKDWLFSNEGNAIIRQTIDLDNFDISKNGYNSSIIVTVYDTNNLLSPPLTAKISLVDPATLLQYNSYNLVSNNNIVGTILLNLFPIPRNSALLAYRVKENVDLFGKPFKQPLPEQEFIAPNNMMNDVSNIGYSSYPNPANLNLLMNLNQPGKRNIEVPDLEPINASVPMQNFGVQTDKHEVTAVPVTRKMINGSGVKEGDIQDKATQFNLATKTSKPDPLRKTSFAMKNEAIEAAISKDLTKKFTTFDIKKSSANFKPKTENKKILAESVARIERLRAINKTKLIDAKKRELLEDRDSHKVFGAKNLIKMLSLKNKTTSDFNIPMSKLKQSKSLKAVKSSINNLKSKPNENDDRVDQSLKEHVTLKKSISLKSTQPDITKSDTQNDTTKRTIPNKIPENDKSISPGDASKNDLNSDKANVDVDKRSSQARNESIPNSSVSFKKPENNETKVETNTESKTLAAEMNDKILIETKKTDSITQVSTKLLNKKAQSSGSISKSEIEIPNTVDQFPVNSLNKENSVKTSSSVLSAPLISKKSLLVHNQTNDMVFKTSDANNKKQDVFITDTLNITSSRSEDAISTTTSKDQLTKKKLLTKTSGIKELNSDKLINSSQEPGSVSTMNATLGQTKKSAQTFIKKTLLSKKF